MAPAKRSRPSFSPPRPGKVKKSSTTANGRSKTTSAGKRSGAGVRKSISNPGRRKKAQDSILIDSEAESDSADEQEEHNESEDDVEEVDRESDSDNDDEENSPQEDDDDDEGNDNISPEPSMILAEVTRENPAIGGVAGDQPILPIPLLHRILHEHFTDKDKTKMSTDAREVVGKYMEVFVREAIMRSTFENSARNTSGAGWLEVEDLERTAVQLCLDF